MVTGTEVEIDIDTDFTLTSANYTPDLVSMMKIASPEDFGAIQTRNSGPKTKIQTFAQLTPAMAKAIQQTDMT